MTYSYTQISQYLRCPRSYRYRYLDGWREKEDRRPCSLAAASRTPWRLLSLGRTRLPRSFKEWGAYRDASLEYTKDDSWDRLVHQGVHLLGSSHRMIAFGFDVPKRIYR